MYVNLTEILYRTCSIFNFITYLLILGKLWTWVSAAVMFGRKQDNFLQFWIPMLDYWISERSRKQCLIATYWGQRHTGNRGEPCQNWDKIIMYSIPTLPHYVQNIHGLHSSSGFLALAEHANSEKLSAPWHKFLFKMVK